LHKISRIVRKEAKAVWKLSLAHQTMFADLIQRCSDAGFDTHALYVPWTVRSFLPDVGRPT
jgi:hypothetical protein